MSTSFASVFHDFANPRLESHMTFVCPECGVEFQSQQDWRRHLNEEHDYIHKTAADFDFKVISESFHECQVCHKWVANANQAIALLQYHRFLHLPFNRTYRCRHCKGGFTRKRALCEHLYRFHSRQIAFAEKMRQTEKEAIKPRAQQQQINEQRSVQDPRLNSEFYLRFICPHCGKNIDKYDQWLKHLDYHQSTSNDLRMHRISGSRNHYCLQCRKLLYTNEQSKLQRHRFTHLPFRLYFKCAFCMVKKSFKSEIFRHFVYAHQRQFNEAKRYIKKPVEWGAKINDRLNTEIDAMLRRYKLTSSAPQPTDLLDGKAQKKQTYAVEKARLAAQRQKYEQDLQYKNANSYPNRKSNIRIVKDYPKIEEIEHSRATPTESTTEDDFEELCADVFESIEEETQSTILNQIDKIEKPNIADSSVKVENLKQEFPMEEELVITIEIMDNETSAESQNFIRTPPRKRLKLDVPVSNPNSTKCQQAIKSEDGSGSTIALIDGTNKKAVLEANIHYLCPECGEEFNEQSSWRTHVFTEHNIENAIQTNFQMLENKQSYLCLDCMDVQNTTKYSDLQRHRFMHMPFQAYLKCKICNKTKSSKPKMMQHLQNCHSHQGVAVNKLYGNKDLPPRMELYPCKNCRKYFTTKERLKLHSAQACEIRSNGMRANISRNNVNNTRSNASILNNMRLLAHLKKAHARMKRIRASEVL